MSQDKKEDKDKKSESDSGAKGHGIYKAIGGDTRQEQIDRAGVGKYVSNETQKFWDDKRKHTV